MDELLKQSDFVVDLVPLSSESLNLITETDLQKKKNGAIFVNVSSGAKERRESNNFRPFSV
jgi:lactate dehydrogenase-like 2-hydroxyacid dehydrogenase